MTNSRSYELTSTLRFEKISECKDAVFSEVKWYENSTIQLSIMKFNVLLCRAKETFVFRWKGNPIKSESTSATDRGKDASTYIGSKEPSCQLVTVNDTLLRGEGCSQVSAALCPRASGGVMLTRQGRGGQILFCTTGGRCFGLYFQSCVLFFIFRNNGKQKFRCWQRRCCLIVFPLVETSAFPTSHSSVSYLNVTRTYKIAGKHFWQTINDSVWLSN